MCPLICDYIRKQKGHVLFGNCLYCFLPSFKNLIFYIDYCSNWAVSPKDCTGSSMTKTSVEMQEKSYVPWMSRAILTAENQVNFLLQPKPNTSVFIMGIWLQCRRMRLKICKHELPFYDSCIKVGQQNMKVKSRVWLFSHFAEVNRASLLKMLVIFGVRNE